VAQPAFVRDGDGGLADRAPYAAKANGRDHVETVAG